LTKYGLDYDVGNQEGSKNYQRIRDLLQLSFHIEKLDHHSIRVLEWLLSGVKSTNELIVKLS
jgi:hypothetical protein